MTMKNFHSDERYKNSVYNSCDLCYYEQCERFRKTNREIG